MRNGVVEKVLFKHKAHEEGTKDTKKPAGIAHKT